MARVIRAEFRFVVENRFWVEGCVIQRLEHCFEVKIDRYRPVFDRIESYQGRPRTQDELNRRSRSDAAHEEEETP